MGLFGRKDRSARLSRARESRQRLLGLAGLIPTREEVAQSRKSFSVLDLGGASSDNLEFFGRLGARLTVADMTPSGTAALSKLLRGDPGTRFDLVLAWDLLNYLSPEQLVLLMDCLVPHVRPGTAIHALIATARDMAPAPLRYRIETVETLVSETSRGPLVRSPRYVEQELLKWLPGVMVEHRFQLRNGMLEYVFSFRSRQRTGMGAAIEEAPRSRSVRAIGWTPAPSR